MDDEARKAFEAASNPDWQQVALNGGPPCFHIDDGRFCLRAEWWGGHPSMHRYISLEMILRVMRLAGMDYRQKMDVQICREVQRDPLHAAHTAGTCARRIEGTSNA